MKEIGEQFKEKREEIGITIDEVSQDLKIDAILIDNLEDGNNKVFKDVLELKNIIEMYAKYLGLDSDKLLDDLNDYLFEKTSKISLEDIKVSLSNVKKEEKDVKKIKSPYTKETKKSSNLFTILIIMSIIVIVLGLFYIVLRKLLVG